MAGRVDQVDQETGGRLLLLLDEGHVLLGHVEEHGDGAEKVNAAVNKCCGSVACWYGSGSDSGSWYFRQ